MNLQEVIAKVQKLLAKGNDKAVSPEESSAFLAKAQQIMDEYKLDVSSLGAENQAKDDNEPIRHFSDDPLDQVKYGAYRETWTRSLAHILAHHNQARIYYSKHADKSITIHIIGRPSDVQVVRYMYGFFKRQVEELSTEGCRGNSSAFRGQFCMGVLDTLRVKLNQEVAATIRTKRNENSGNEMALVRVNQAVLRLEKRGQAVDAFIKSTIRLGKGRGFNAKTETGGRTAGRVAGEQLRMTSAKGSLAGGHQQIAH